MSMTTIMIDKGKVHPRKCHEGPEKEYRYNSIVSLTLLLNGGWVVLTMPRCTATWLPTYITSQPQNEANYSLNPNFYEQFSIMSEVSVFTFQCKYQNPFQKGVLKNKLPSGPCNKKQVWQAANST
jgi:hypothetical protein